MAISGSTGLFLAELVRFQLSWVPSAPCFVTPKRGALGTILFGPNSVNQDPHASGGRRSLGIDPKMFVE